MIRRGAHLGSFRGMTYGHEEMIEDIATDYDEVIVGIGINPNKSAEFSLAELESNARHILRRIPNVRVISYSGLFTNFLVKHEVDAVVRGIRSGEEFKEQLAYERFADNQYRKLVKGNNGQPVKWFSTYYKSSRDGSEFISSSTVKDILKDNGDAEGYAPTSTIAQIQARLFHRYSYGVTGVSGAGKTTVCREFKNIAAALCIPLHHVNIDELAREILTTAQDDSYKTFRQELFERYGEGVVVRDDLNGIMIDSSPLGKILFDKPEEMDWYNGRMRPLLLGHLCDKTRTLKGIQLLDSWFFEAGLTHLANHNVLVVDADMETRKERLSKRQGLSEEQVERRAQSQYTTENKKAHIQKAIDAADYGSLRELINDKHTTYKDIKTAFYNMLEDIDVFGEMRICGFLERHKVADPQKAYDTIRELYSGPERRYHSLSHIVDGLNLIHRFDEKISNPDAFMLAWMFHDSIYAMDNPQHKASAKQKPKGESPFVFDPALFGGACVPEALDPGCLITNEEQSADLMVEMAKAWKFDDANIEKAKRLILLTQIDKMSPVTEDEKYFVDLDMSVLGGSPNKFAVYEQGVRTEFELYTEAAWIKGRMAFLQSLDTENLYHTAFFRERFGAQAKENIDGSLEALARKSALCRGPSPVKGGPTL